MNASVVSPVFVGRHGEMASLATQMQRACGGEAAFALIRSGVSAARQRRYIHILRATGRIVTKLRALPSAAQSPTCRPSKSASRSWTHATAVPGLDAKDAIDIQVTVESLATADELAAALRSAGYPRIDDVSSDVAKLDARSTAERYDHSGDPTLWHKRLHGSADPGRSTFVHLRVDSWPNQQFALLFVDWLKANPEVRDEYLAVKRRAQQAASPDGDIERYLAIKEPWFLEAYRRAWDWADRSGWRP